MERTGSGIVCVSVCMECCEVHAVGAPCVCHGGPRAPIRRAPSSTPVDAPAAQQPARGPVALRPPGAFGVALMVAIGLAVTLLQTV